MKSLPFILMFALINSCIELEISAPSFPDIVVAFNTSENMVGLTITYNLIGFCLASLVYGPLSDLFGRRRIMLIGNAILVIGAVACVIATSIGWLLIARIIQGVGAATSAVVVSAIIADVYKAEQAAKLYGLMNAVFSTMMAFAPIIGGIINYQIGWRGNYGAVAIICVISWLLMYWFLPETKTGVEKLNIRGLLSGYKQLFSSASFLSAATAPSLLYGGYMAFVAIAPFIYMNRFNLDMASYAFNQGAIIASFAITSAAFGQIIKVLGKKMTLLVATCLSFIGSIMMIFSTSSFELTVSMSIFSVGSALIYPIIFAYSVEIFPDIKGVASSVIMSLRYLLCSIITGFATYFYNGNPRVIGIVMSIVSTTVCMLYCVLFKKI